MRITGGTLKGRRLAVKNRSKDLRPTTERVREAIFSTLNSLKAIDGKTALDLFAGSGAMGIEALSRGTSFVHFVEQHRASIDQLSKNLRTLDLIDKTALYHEKAEKWLTKKSTPTSTLIELVFIDPPYRTLNLSELLSSLSRHPLLHENALFILESEREANLELLALKQANSKLELLKEKEYGDSRVFYLVKSD